MPLPMAVPRCSWKRSIAALTSSRLSVGACTTAAVPANDTTAILHVARQVGDEALGRLLRGDQAVRLHVGGAHAARDVDRQDDRLLRRGQGDQRRRPRRGEQQRAQRQQQQHRRHVAAPGAAAAHRLAAPGRGWRSAGSSSCAGVTQEDVERDQQRHGQHRPQHVGPEEGHEAAWQDASSCGSASRATGAPRRAAAPVGEPAALLPQVGEAQDGVDQVVVGGELERVDAGPGEAFAQRGLAPLGGGREALAKAARCGCRPAAARRSRRRASSPGRCRAGPSRAGRTGAPRSPRGAAPAGRAPSPSRAR